jgi:2-keto-3-deoxy-L-fuconate dehydrogenase
MMKPPFTLNGKTAVVTGGGSGIGLAIVKRFLQSGANVEILDLHSGNIDAAKHEAINGDDKFPGKLDGVACDVGDFHSVEKAFSDILARHAKIDVLINNAGIAHVGNALNTTPEDFQRIQQVNVNGVAYCTQAALKSMTTSGGGVILNLSSIAATIAVADRFAYSTSKGAVLAMTFSVAKDYLAYNVRCNALLPGRIHTPFVDGFISKNYPGREQEMFEKLSKTQPIGRMGTPDEVATAALFLCSDEASFITGGAYPVDGGTFTLR